MFTLKITCETAAGTTTEKIKDLTGEMALLIRSERKAAEPFGSSNRYEITPQF